MGALIHRDVAFEVGATSASHIPPPTPFALRRGVCQDHAQIFIACGPAAGRSRPLRVRPPEPIQDGVYEQEAAHAWAEAYVEDLGWVGFDPANGVCPTDHYVRVAVGLDAQRRHADPRRTSYGGGQPKALSVALHVRPVQQGQQQHQTRGWS